MSVFFVARLAISDPGLYAEYLGGFDEVFAGSGGEVVAVDDETLTLEGSPPPGRSVIIRFPDEAALRSWYESPGYQRLKAIRNRASQGVVIMVHGR